MIGRDGTINISRIIEDGDLAKDRDNNALIFITKF
jgi:hypothetical protein